MSNSLSPAMMAQLFAQESNDPFLFLLTLSHSSWGEEIYLVNNTEAITSRGKEFVAFPMSIKLPIDDGETARSFSIEFDNVSLQLIEGIRTVTTPISVKIEMILASIPDEVQMSQEELLIQNITYNKSRVVATVILDSFLNTEVTSERYGPTNFPGLF
jgi:hypothetical protein